MNKFITTALLISLAVAVTGSESRPINQVKKKPVVVKFTDTEGNTEKILIERKPNTLPPLSVKRYSFELNEDTSIDIRRDDSSGRPPNEVANPIHDVIHEEEF
ncbi:MAG: hypothetical protein SFU25_11825 [Candidatus Caenarcaniphilales bacterium]|nr:hypothetical protein [Candidatus Caenarcaniphilales bacterium]